MEFGIEKCTRLIIKSEKRQIKDGMELPNQEEKENVQIPANIGSWHHQTRRGTSGGVMVSKVD